MVISSFSKGTAGFSHFGWNFRNILTSTSHTSSQDNKTGIVSQDNKYQLYAIPISKVTTIADDIKNGVKDTAYSYGYPAFLGVGLGDGTVVQGVYDGTSAADAGIAAGDTITAVDGKAIADAAALSTVTADRLAEITAVEDDLARRHVAVAELDLRYRDQVIARLQ